MPKTTLALAAFASLALVASSVTSFKVNASPDGDQIVQQDDSTKKKKKKAGSGHGSHSGE